MFYFTQTNLKKKGGYETRPSNNYQNTCVISQVPCQQSHLVHHRQQDRRLHRQ